MIDREDTKEYEDKIEERWKNNTFHFMLSAKEILITGIDYFQTFEVELFRRGLNK